MSRLTNEQKQAIQQLLEKFVDEIRDVCTNMGTPELRKEMSKVLMQNGFAPIPGYENVKL